MCQGCPPCIIFFLLLINQASKIHIVKKGISIFILALLIFSSIKPLAYALNTHQTKSRFVLFCMASKNGSASCPHEACPLMDSADVKGSKQSCDTKIGCETTHHQEAASSFVNGD